MALRFQFRYAAPQPTRRLELEPATLWFHAVGPAPAAEAARHKVEQADVTRALAAAAAPLR